MLIECSATGWLFGLLIAYLGIGLPMPSPNHQLGPTILLYIPRLPLMVAVLLGTYALLWSVGDGDSGRDWTKHAWAGLLAMAALFGIRSTFRMEQAVRQEYPNRVVLRTPSLSYIDPVIDDAGTHFIAETPEGYRLVSAGDSVETDHSADDDLSFTIGARRLFIEKAHGGESVIIDPRDPAKTIAENARSPMISADGQEFAFVRDDHGRGTLMVQSSLGNGHSGPVALTPPSIDVYEATFSSRRAYAVSGVESGRPPQIYLTDQNHSNTRLDLGESRYPALSQDGRWMAYSHMEDGAWNLWIRDQKTGSTRRVANLPCDQIESSWERDSKTLVYATDCGRSLWLTGISRRHVIP